MKNIILIFLLAFIGICYAAPPIPQIEKYKHACVNVFEPVAVVAQKQLFSHKANYKKILQKTCKG